MFIKDYKKQEMLEDGGGQETKFNEAKLNPRKVCFLFTYTN